MMNMKSSIQPTACILALSLLGACAGTPASHDPSQPQIEARYRQASESYQQKMAPLAQYFVKNCSPLPDKAYLDCINAKRNEIAALSIYPDTAATIRQRQNLEQQFLAGQINRKQLRAELEALKAKQNAEQLKHDIAAGAYSGRY